MRLTLRHFELVQALHAQGSITSAARFLGVTQPALSRALKGLEDQIGGKLFEVSDKGLIATPLADVFLRRYHTLRRPLEEILNEIDALKSSRTGQIIIGTGTYAAPVSLYRAIARTHRSLPAVKFDLLERDWRDIMLELVAGTINLAIVDISAAEKNSEFDYEALPHHACGIAVRRDHPLTKKNHIAISDLINFPYCGTFPSRWTLSHAGYNANLFGAAHENFSESGVQMAVHTLPAIASMIKNSDAFGIIPRVFFHSESPVRFIHDLVLLNCPDLEWLRTNYGMIWRRNRPPGPTIEVLMNHIRAIEAELVTDEVRLGIPRPRQKPDR